MTDTPLEDLARYCNSVLASAGCVSRWELDGDPSSNSFGTWFCGTLGGVTDQWTMRQHSHSLLMTKERHPESQV